MRARLYEINMLLTLLINLIFDTGYEFILDKYASVGSVSFSSTVGLGHQIDEIGVCGTHR